MKYLVIFKDPDDHTMYLESEKDETLTEDSREAMCLPWKRIEPFLNKLLENEFVFYRVEEEPKNKVVAAQHSLLEFFNMVKRRTIQREQENKPWD